MAHTMHVGKLTLDTHIMYVHVVAYIGYDRLCASWRRRLSVCDDVYCGVPGKQSPPQTLPSVRRRYPHHPTHGTHPFRSPSARAALRPGAFSDRPIYLPPISHTSGFACFQNTKKTWSIRQRHWRLVCYLSCNENLVWQVNFGPETKKKWPEFQPIRNQLVQTVDHMISDAKVKGIAPEKFISVREWPKCIPIRGESFPTIFYTLKFENWSMV